MLLALSGSQPQRESPLVRDENVRLPAKGEGVLPEKDGGAAAREGGAVELNFPNGRAIPQELGVLSRMKYRK